MTPDSYIRTRVRSDDEYAKLEARDVEPPIIIDDLEDPDSPWRGIPHKPAGFIKEGTTMQVYVAEDMAHRLTKAAAKIGVSRSELVRVACRTFMEDNGLWSLRGPQKGTQANE